MKIRICVAVTDVPMGVAGKDGVTGVVIYCILASGAGEIGDFADTNDKS